MRAALAKKRRWQTLSFLDPTLDLAQDTFTPPLSPFSASSSVATRAFFDGSSRGDNTTAPEDDDGGSRALLAYSQAVTADDVEFFTRAAPSHVVGAMTETVSGLLGSLACSAMANSSARANSGGSASTSSSFPASAAAAIASSSSGSPSSAAAFEVRVRARDADLGQLLYSTLMTGYLMRNAASRLRLRSRLSDASGGSESERGGSRGALPAVLLPPPTATATAAEAPPALPSPSPPPSPSLLPPSSGGSPEAVDPTTLPPEARAVALAALEGTPRLAPGTQTSRVEGDVFKWDQSHGLVSVPAADYIKALEAELASARAAAAAADAAASGKEVALSAPSLPSKEFPPLPATPASSSPLSNPLLAFVRSADEASLTSLTAEASAGVLEAANAFVQRVMTGGERLESRSRSSRVFGAGGFGVAVGGNGKGEAENVIREYRASELRHLLLFVMVVGFMLRTLEARLDIEFSMLLPPSSEEDEEGRRREEE